MTQMQKRIQLVKQIQTRILRIMVQTFQPSVENSFFIKKMANTDSFCIFFVSFQTTYEQWGGSPGLVVKGGGS